VGIFALKIVGIGFGFLTNLLLALFLGISDYGAYTYIFSWLGLLTVLAGFGLNNVITREIAAYQTKSSWGLINGISVN